MKRVQSAITSFRKAADNAENYPDNNPVPAGFSWLLAGLLLLLPASVNAQFTYTTNSGAITITGYTGPGGSVVVPDSVDGYPVTSIGDMTFEYYTNLTSVEIGTNVTRIGFNAFYSCLALTSVVIPDSVNSIGGNAFALCANLTNIIVGSGVATIDLGAFYYCSSLTSIYFRGNRPDTASANVFEGDFNLTAYYLPGTSGWSSMYFQVPAVMLNPPVPAGSLQATIIPAGAIAAGARWQVDGGISQPSGAAVLGLSVGYHTVSFSTVSPWTTPANQIVFVSTNSTGTATGICTQPLQYQLTYTTNADNTLTLTGYTPDLGDTVAIPAAINGLLVTSIGSRAFRYCFGLTGITIPTNVVSIGDNAFELCTNLTSVTISSSVTNIGSYAFWFCTSLTNIMIASGVTSIGDDAFGYCENLTGVIIPSGVSSIGQGVFQYCSALTTVVIPNGITNIGDSAFYLCNSLTNITIPNSVTDIGQSAFWGCSSLDKITIPTGISIVNRLTFAFCGSLTSVTIPNSVTTLDNYAFFGCTSLTNVYFQGNAPDVGGSVFEGDSIAIVHYLLGTTGWEAIFAGLPTVVLRSAPLTVLISGDGRVTPNYSGQLLRLGKRYTLSAKAGAGCILSNWVEAGIEITNGNTVRFIMQPNLVLKASFVTNPFIAVAGNYVGLFYGTNNGVTVSNAGYVTATVTRSGGFTAKFRQGSKAYSLSGRFPLNGDWVTGAIKGATNFGARLRLDLAGESIEGQFGNDSWIAEVAAHRAVYSQTNPAPQAGQYTLVIPGSDNPAILPGGHGAAAIKLSPSGAVKVRGILGDGTPLAENTLLSKQGQWPLYASLYSSKGILIGWLNFTNNTVPVSDLEGVIAWIKPGQTGNRIYPNGFDWPYDARTNNAFGSVFTNRMPLVSWTNGVAILENGNLAGNLMNGLSMDGSGKATGTNQLKLTITTSGSRAGLFKGSVLDTATGRTILLNGALLQKQDIGYGSFLGTNQSGSVLITPLSPP